MRIWKRRPKEKGSVLAATTIIALLAVVMAVGVGEFSTYQVASTARYEIYKNEFAVAEAVVAKAFAELRFLVQNSGPPLAGDLAGITAPTFEDYTVQDFSIGKVSDQYEVVSQGPWAGLTLHKILYRITAQVHQDGKTSNRLSHQGVRLSQDLELRYVPLHAFAAFFHSDLELHPGPAMTLNGRLHSNGNIYLSSGDSLALEGYLTAVGQILHGHHPDAGMAPGGGDVALFDGANPVSMQPGEGGWLDNPDSNWATEARNRWNGYVNDEAHCVGEMPLPIPRGEDPHTLIERADPANDPPSLQDQKFEYQAGLRILRDPDTGVVGGFLQDGTPVPLTYPNPGNPSEERSTVSEGTFYDGREQQWISTIDVNIAYLIESGVAPENGILYISNEGANGAVRVTDASELPSNLENGFSIASDDAVYIQGDFNTVNQQAALVAGDAVTVLSNAWDDAKSASNDLDVRKAIETTVNGVFFQGVVPTQIDPGDGVTPRYSGGVENFFRLLENWNGTLLHFSGSMICLWNSQKWTGWWRDWPAYRPADRDWSWDAALSGVDGPPGSPKVYEVIRRNWNVHSL